MSHILMIYCFSLPPRFDSYTGQNILSFIFSKHLHHKQLAVVYSFEPLQVVRCQLEH